MIVAVSACNAAWLSVQIWTAGFIMEGLSIMNSLRAAKAKSSAWKMVEPFPR